MYMQSLAPTTLSILLASRKHLADFVLYETATVNWAFIPYATSCNIEVRLMPNLDGNIFAFQFPRLFQGIMEFS